MTPAVTKAQAKRLVGKYVYAMKKDGTVAEGKLVRIKGSQLILVPKKSKKGVQTKAFITPLVLFDLLAIGTSPFVNGFGFGGFGPGFGFGGFGPGFGFGGFGPGFF